MVDRWPRAVVVGFALVAAVVMSAGCGSDEPDQQAASVSTDAVLIALVDWAVESDPPPTTTGDEPPVVYITASNGDTIDAAAQASVVAATADDAEADDQHVHDDGVLLVVGELPADVPLSDVTVERYRDLDDTSVFVVTLTVNGDGASVTGAQTE